ncbi:hypothetical protein ACP6PL_02785 [Dapis sp. BLCC M126]|uniref:hypothetical protein n=1 Tax=Dapis sp. BLCC M126 TaxID=3400189 RepID=UPI003CF3EC73
MSLKKYLWIIFIIVLKVSIQLFLGNVMQTAFERVRQLPRLADEQEIGFHAFY